MKLLCIVQLTQNAHEPTVVISKERRGEYAALTSYSCIAFQTPDSLDLPFERLYAAVLKSFLEDLNEALPGACLVLSI